MLAEGRLVDQVLRHGRGLVVRAVDLLDHDAALAVQLLRVEFGASHEVAQQVDRLRRRLRAHGDVERHEIVTRIGVEHAAQALGRLVDVLVGGVLLPALEHQMLEEVRHPVLLAALGARARIERHEHRQRARARQAHGVHGQAVARHGRCRDVRHWRVTIGDRPPCPPSQLRAAGRCRRVRLPGRRANTVACREKCGVELGLSLLCPAMPNPSDGPSRPVRTIPRRALARHIRPVRPQVLAPEVPSPQGTPAAPSRPSHGPGANTVIEFRGVSKHYDSGDTGLERATFAIDRQEFVFLVGATGSGKSTIMRLLIKEIDPTEGIIRVAGRHLGEIERGRIPYYRRNFGVVFQDFKLLPTRTVYDNIAYALQVTGASRKQIRATLPDILRLTGLSTKLHNYPHQLSGGEQQRVAVARAFASHPPLLLADEPTGNLDPHTSIGIMQLLYRINRAGTTVVVATHDNELVDKMRRRVIELRRGRIIRDEATGLYAQDETTGDLAERLKRETAAGDAAGKRPDGGARRCSSG